MPEELETYREELERIEELVREGHTYHCACRMVYGDGECECQLKGIIPGSLSRWICDLSDELTREPDGDEPGQPAQGETVTPVRRGEQ